MTYKYKSVLNYSLNINNMSEILDVLTKQFGGQVLESISQQSGLNKSQTGSILSSALPILVGAMARNSSQQGGAESLHKALQKDHDGSILDNVGGFLQNSQSGPGAGILRHVLGGRRGNVENALSKQTGVNSGAIGNVLEMAAPILMGMLGKQQRQSNLDAGGLSGILKMGVEQMNQKSPGSEGLLGQLLDQDGDGDIKDDVARIGFNLLGKFLKK